MDPRTCPLTRREILDAYFLEHRGKLLELAAFLDRLDRASDGPAEAAEKDPRHALLERALELLRDGEGDRARRVQELLSDESEEPAERAAECKPTDGAPAEIRSQFE